MQRSEYAPTVAETPVPPSVFRAFDPDEFIEWSTWRRLETILENNGGAYGIAGPRGSGKTWLIQRGVHRATAVGGLGLWFPSPSNYSAVEFLTALSENFAAEVQRIAQAGAPRWYDRLASVPLFVVSLLLVVAAAYSVASPLGPLSPLLAAPPFVAGALLLSGVLMGLRRRGSASMQLFRGAAALQERIRYSEARRTSAEATAGLKGPSWLGSIRSSKERDLTERTFHLASLVHELRVLMSLTAGLLRRPIVVAIDELDKIHDPDDARKLLRDIKGIFEVAGVHFLVSVSREAQRTLDLGSIRGRDEFQSSFYAVVAMETRSPGECAELLWKRLGPPAPMETLEPGAVQDEAARALGVLGEGNLREVTRLAQIALDELTDRTSRSSDRHEPAPLTPHQAVHSVLKAEVQAFQTELLNSPLHTQVKSRAHDALPSWQTADPRPTRLASIQEEWILLEPDEKSRASSAPNSSIDDYIEGWRRLLVRLAIGGTILGYLKVLRENQGYWSELQSITSVAGSSAWVAARRLHNVRDKLYSLELGRLQRELQELLDDLGELVDERRDSAEGESDHLLEALIELRHRINELLELQPRNLEHARRKPRIIDRILNPQQWMDAPPEEEAHDQPSPLSLGELLDRFREPRILSSLGRMRASQLSVRFDQVRRDLVQFEAETFLARELEELRTRFETSQEDFE